MRLAYMRLAYSCIMRPGEHVKVLQQYGITDSLHSRINFRAKVPVHVRKLLPQLFDGHKLCALCLIAEYYTVSHKKGDMWRFRWPAIVAAGLCNHNALFIQVSHPCPLGAPDPAITVIPF